MEYIILVQIIGFIGYFVYTSSAYFKNRLSILLVDALGCLICCLHWYLLEDMRLFWSNIIWLYIALIGTIQGKTKYDKFLLSLSFLMVAFMTTTYWEGRITDATILIGNYVAISVKFYTDMVKFRRQSIISFIFATGHTAVAGSVAGVLFSLTTLFGHVYHYALLKGLNPARFMIWTKKEAAPGLEKAAPSKA